MTKPSSTDAQTPPTSVLPDWAVEQPRSALAAMLLIGTWTPSAVADEELLEQFGCSIDQVRELCEVLVNQKPPMMVFHQHRYGAARDSQPRYAWVDRQAAWWLLAGVLDAKALDRLAQLAVSVLGAAGDNAEEQSDALTDALPHALGQSLALLGHSDGIVICEPAPSTRAAELVTALLGSKTAPFQLPLRSRLATQPDLLPLLAEAAPDAFLTALATAVAKPSFDKLQESDVRPLCRALETLAWDTDLLERAAMLLARLVQLLPSGRTGSRLPQPLENLHGMFSWSMPQTCAPIDERLTAMEHLCQTIPDVAWELLAALLGSGGLLHQARKPWVWSLSLPPERGFAYQGEDYAQIEAFLTMAAELAGTDAVRWAALVEKLDWFPEGLPEKLLQMLQQIAPTLDDPEAKVWAELDRQRQWYEDKLSTQQSEASDVVAVGRVGDESQNRQAFNLTEDPQQLLAIHLKSLIAALAPTDLRVRLGSLFQSGTSARFNTVGEGEEPVRKAQQDALAEISQRPDYWELLAQIVENSDAPGTIAYALAESPLADVVAARLRPRADLGPFEKIAGPFWASWVMQQPFSELETLLRLLVDAGRTDDAVKIASLYYFLDRETQLWDLLDAIGDPLCGAYWRNREPLYFNNQRNTTQQQRAIANFLHYQRLDLAVNAAVTGKPPLPTDQQLNILEQVAEQARRPKNTGNFCSKKSVDDKLVCGLLAQITPTTPAQYQRAYQLELALLSAYKGSRYSLRFIPSYITEHPEDFAQLILHCDNSSQVCYLPQLTRSVLADLLRAWPEFPGASLQPDAAGDFLWEWVQEVLRQLDGLLTTNEARAESRDYLAQLLCRPVGADGLWPCLAVRQLLQVDASWTDALYYAKRNYNRGPTLRRTLDGGQQERTHARSFTEMAALLGKQWTVAKEILLRLAKSYEDEAHRRDQDFDARKHEMNPPKLPIRPLFPLTRVRISQFRGIDGLTIAPHPRLTLLFGKNASGKSSLLDAIAVGLGFLGPSLPRLEESDPKWPRFAPKDMRRTFLEDGTPVLEKQQEVQLWGQPQGEYPQPLHWQTGDRISGRGPQIIDRLGPGLEAYLAQVTDALRTNDDKVLMPVFVHYGVERAVSPTAQEFVRPPDEQLIPRMAGLKGALVSTARFDWAVTQLWVMEFIESAEQKKRRNFDYRWPRLEAVREAIKANLKTPDGARCENPRVLANKRKLVVDHFTADGRKQELEIGQLSDGFRTHLALVMDLALRMVICNPPPEETGTDIPDGYGTRSYAVVLLDEIDLHLHPSWQHIVLRGLLDAFPNAQFFVTTHSEQVLSSVDSTEEALVLMVETKGGEVVAVSPERPTYGARGQDLLKMMGVPERGPYPITEKLDQYLRLIDDGQGHSQEALALRQGLDHTLHPRDTALLGADIEMRRQDGIAKRAKKP